MFFFSNQHYYAIPCRNWTFKHLALVAQKKERDGVNKKSDTLGFELRNSGCRTVRRSYQLCYGASWQFSNLNPSKLEISKSFRRFPCPCGLYFLSTCSFLLIIFYNVHG